MAGSKEQSLAVDAMEQPIVGLVAGIELAYRSLQTLRKRGTMASKEQRRELQGLLEAELSAGEPSRYDVHDNTTVNIYNGLDAEAVERLIKLARTG